MTAMNGLLYNEHHEVVRGSAECLIVDKEHTMTVADLIRSQIDDLPEDMQREALDFLLFLRMKAAHGGRVSGADMDMLSLFGAVPDFPDRLPDPAPAEPARW